MFRIRILQFELCNARATFVSCCYAHDSSLLQATAYGRTVRWFSWTPPPVMSTTSPATRLSSLTSPCRRVSQNSSCPATWHTPYTDIVVDWWTIILNPSPKRWLPSHIQYTPIGMAKILYCFLSGFSYRHQKGNLISIQASVFLWGRLGGCSLLLFVPYLPGNKIYFFRFLGTIHFFLGGGGDEQEKILFLIFNIYSWEFYLIFNIYSREFYLNESSKLWMLTYSNRTVFFFLSSLV